MDKSKIPKNGEECSLEERMCGCEDSSNVKTSSSEKENVGKRKPRKNAFRKRLDFTS